MKEYKIQARQTSYYSNYAPQNGYLATLSATNEAKGIVYRGAWQSCREIFARHFNSLSKGIVIAFSNGAQRGNARSFFIEVEKRLGIKSSTTILCAPNSVLAIVLNPWWTENSMRRQLLTVLLRAGKKYKGDFDAALDGYNYSKQTKAAIYKFLKGYTNFPNFRSGWVRAFAPVTRYNYRYGYSGSRSTAHVEKNLAKMTKN